MRTLIVLFSIILAGVVGMLIDSNLGLDGNFSVVFAVAMLGAFEVYYKYDKNDKDKGDEREESNENDDKP